MTCNAACPGEKYGLAYSYDLKCILKKDHAGQHLTFHEFRNSTVTLQWGDDQKVTIMQEDGGWG